MDSLLAYLSATNNQGVVIAFATIVMAITAIITTILTWGLFRENRLLRKAGTEPEVHACLMLSPRLWNQINLALYNVGQAPAKNINFLIEADEADFLAHEVRLTIRAPQTAINFLPQGQQVASDFGGQALFKEPRMKPFKVRVDYEDIKGKKYWSTTTLDVSQFNWIARLGAPAEHEIAEALKKMEQHLSKFGISSGRLKVETITADQVRKEYEERLKEIKSEYKNETKET